MPTIDVNLFDTRVTLKRKRQLAEALTRIAVETFDTSEDEVTIVFRRSFRHDVARGGRIGRQ